MTLRAPRVDRWRHERRQHPNERATGITSDGQRWAVARFGALVVTQVGDHTDDEQLPDEQTARLDFAEQVATLTPQAAG